MAVYKTAHDASPALVVEIGTSLHEAERALILATLEHCGGVRKLAARQLGISLKTLYNRLLAYRPNGTTEPALAHVPTRDPVDAASIDSFPASDPPARSPTRAGPPRR